MLSPFRKIYLATLLGCVFIIGVSKLLDVPQYAGVLRFFVIQACYSILCCLVLFLGAVFRICILCLLPCFLLAFIWGRFTLAFRLMYLIYHVLTTADTV